MRRSAVYWLDRQRRLCRIRCCTCRFCIFASRKVLTIPCRTATLRRNHWLPRHAVNENGRQEGRMVRSSVGTLRFWCRRSRYYSVRRARGAEVYVATRDRDRHQSLALELGARWVGGTFDEPPVKLDAAIIFAPAGELVPIALKALSAGGTLVLGGIHMSQIPSFDYSLIYGERLRSVANNTREDGRNFSRRRAEFWSAPTSRPSIHCRK